MIYMVCFLSFDIGTGTEWRTFGILVSWVLKSRRVEKLFINLISFSKEDYGRNITIRAFRENGTINYRGQ